MKTTRLFWIPRVVAILAVLFVSLFAFDVFEGEESFLWKLAGFLIHLAPSYLLVGMLVLAWFRPLIGGWVFISVGVLASLFVITGPLLLPHANIMFTSLIVTVIPILIGLLFIWVYHQTRK